MTKPTYLPLTLTVRYFWGYRNHVLNDTSTELPIRDITKPANFSDIKVAKYLLHEACSLFNLNLQMVTRDANYDAEGLLKYIINDLKAFPIIPRNPRRKQLNVIRLQLVK